MPDVAHVAIVGTGLIGCAWAAASGRGFAALAVAALTVALLLVVLGCGARRA